MIPGVILAGGQSQRMGGGDKGLMPLRGRPLLAHVIARFSPQVSDLAVNANGDAGRFAALGLPVLADSVDGFAGPLAGVLAAMDWAAGQGGDLVITVAADLPFLPGDLVPQLMFAAGDMAEPLSLAASADATGAVRMHPTCGLWSVALREDLRMALAQGQRRMQEWAQSHGARRAVFPSGRGDAFFNVNTPQDLARAETLLG